MPDEPIKKRRYRAKQKAMEHFTEAGYAVIESDNRTFCFIATRRREIRLIRVVVDEITPSDIKAASSVAVPPECSREIFCQKGTRFMIKEIL